MAATKAILDKLSRRVAALESALARRDEHIVALEARLAQLQPAAASGGATMALASPESLLRTAKPQLEVASFSSALLDQAFHVQVVFLDDSLLVWVGLAATPPSLENMCMAMESRFEREALTKSVLGDSDEAQAMSQRLCMRTGRQVFVSCDLQPAEDPGQLAAFVEKKLCTWLDERGCGRGAAPSAAPQ